MLLVMTDEDVKELHQLLDKLIDMQSGNNIHSHYLKERMYGVRRIKTVLGMAGITWPIDWSMLPEWGNWIGIDSNEDAYLYEDEPEYDNRKGQWMPQKLGSKHIKVHFYGKLPHRDFEKLIFKRE